MYKVEIMQIYAYDELGEEQISHLAAKNKSYFCLECLGSVALRSGPYVRPHFYHLGKERPCRIRTKTATHLQVQTRFLNLLPAGAARMERYFPEIKRIADIIWEAEKLIFEIQVSPLSAEEIAARNQAYLSQGYQVVWILHDNRFNRRKMTAAEVSLTSQPHYFTNIDPSGAGGFFDQFSYHDKGLRIRRLFRRPVNLLIPLRDRTTSHLPRLIHHARQKWPVSFQGDLTHTPLDPRQLEEAFALERKLAPLGLRAKLKKKLIRACKFIGYLLLEGATG